jgi:PII-like signaling protein
VKTNTADVVMVRIYLTEKEKNLKHLLKHLHEREHVRGVTVFRGIAGFGSSGVMHSASLLDMSLDLPLVVEFFDRAERVETTIDDLNTMIEPGHVVTWPARMCVGGDR